MYIQKKKLMELCDTRWYIIMRKKQNTASSTCCQLCESDVGTWGGVGCCAPSLEGQGLREPGSAQEKRQGAQV